MLGLAWFTACLAAGAGAGQAGTYCSPVMARYSSSEGVASGVETRLGVRLGVGQTACLLEAGQLRAMVTLLPSSGLLYPVVEQYEYTAPRPALSCYCHCSSAQQCSLPRCPLCYNTTMLVAGGPHCKAGLPATTCCSVRLSRGPTRTALRLGPPVLALRYTLTLFRAGLRVGGTDWAMQVGPGGTTVSHALKPGRLLVSFSRPGPAPPAPRPAWLLAGAGGWLQSGLANKAREQDPRLPGWLKVERGRVVPPPASLVWRELQITTVDCSAQQFRADWGRLAVDTGLERAGLTNTGLEWDGEQLVTRPYTGRMWLSLLATAPHSLSLHGNSTLLAGWNARLTLGPAGLLSLNITLAHGSHGLILGTLRNTSFSLLARPGLPAPALSLLLPGLTAGPARLCLQAEPGQPSCQEVQVTRQPAPPSPAAPPRPGVQPIPVLWHQVQLEDSVG